MIGWLKGSIVRRFQNGIVLDVNGVGYKIFTLQKKIPTSNILEFHIHHHIREDQNAIYGFTEIEQLNLFEMLLTVSGVGPKLALTILSNADVNQISNAIEQNQSAVLQSIPGVGAKVAAKIVVELKNKISQGALDLNLLTQSNDTIDALLSLGYSQKEILTALYNIPNELSTNQQIKWALQKLGS